MPDARADDFYRNAPAPLRHIVDTNDIRTLLVVPLRKDGAVLGVITAFRREVRLFTDKQVALLESFAAQAVIAMENARLLTETREALEQQTATAEVLQVINSSPGDLAPVFESILEKAHSLCGAPLGSLVLRDGDLLRAVATRGYPQEYDVLARQGFPPTPTFRSFLSGEPFVHVLDGSEPPTASEDHPIRRAAAEIAGIRTVLFVPLRKDATVLGYISAQRQEVRPFTDKQIALLQNFAAQAVIAMENARLLTETREALEQQTATAEVLQVINSSPGDLAPVFNAMLEKALSLCEASFGIMNTYEGERLLRVAEPGLTPAYNQWREANPLASPSTGIPVSLRRLIAGERVVHIADLKTTETYQVGNSNARALIDLAGARTNLTVALRRGHTVCGMFTIFRQEVRPFTDKQIALLQNFAAQAVIVMENARLLTETREALEQQTATAEVLQVINSSPGDLAPVFDAILEKAHALCGVAHGALVLREGETFRAVATHSYSERFAEQLRHAYRGADNPLTRALLDGERFVHIPDLAQIAHPMIQASVENDGVRTGLYVPLRKDDALLGMISSCRREVRPFSEKEIALVENFAAQAVIAMENARLITETCEALEQQTATAEVLQVINSSPGDLTPVFDTMLSKAFHLCGGVQGSLRTFDGCQAKFAAAQGLSAEFVEILREQWERRGPSEHHPMSRLMRGERVVQLLDIAASDLYLAGDSTAVAAVELGRVRTLMFVAMQKDDAPYGAFIIARREVQPFTDKQIALLQNFAAQAVIAMENARLLTETREALEQQTATAEVLQVINSSPGDLTPVFDAILAKAKRLCETAFGTLFTYDGERFHLAAMDGPRSIGDAIDLRQPQVPEQGGLLARHIAGENLIHTPDLTADRELYLSHARRRFLVDELAMRTCLSIAMRKDTKLVGVIGVYRQEVRPYSEKQIALLENFGASGHRDGECAAPDRDARGLGAADCERDGAGGHQLLAGRPRSRVRRNSGKGPLSL
jgi:GAF domain-containing protein